MGNDAKKIIKKSNIPTYAQKRPKTDDKYEL